MAKLTAIELGEKLRSSLENHVKGGHFVQPGMEDLMAERLKDSVGLPKAMFDIGGVSALKGLLSYHDERDQIQRYQLENEISGLTVRNVTANGIDCSHLDYDWQLTLLPSDIERLKQEVQPTTDKFLAAITGYHLFRNVSDEEQVIATIEEVMAAASGMGYAWIHTNSTEWAEATEGQFKGRMMGRSIERPDPDEIWLHLTEHPINDSGPAFIAIPQRELERWGWA